MGILKNYEDGFVCPAARYNQFAPKNIPIYELIMKDIKGYVRLHNGSYWVIYWEEEKYFKSFFARNDLWFKALTNEPQFLVVGKLPQIVLI